MHLDLRLAILSTLMLSWPCVWDHCLAEKYFLSRACFYPTKTGSPASFLCILHHISFYFNKMPSSCWGEAAWCSGVFEVWVVLDLLYITLNITLHYKSLFAFIWPQNLFPHHRWITIKHFDLLQTCFHMVLFKVMASVEPPVLYKPCAIDAGGWREVDEK